MSDDRDVGSGLKTQLRFTSLCPICKKRLEVDDKITRIREKGANGINAASVKRGDDILVSVGCDVHTDCRRWYTNPRDIENSLKRSTGCDSESLKRSARISTGPYDSGRHCLYCGVCVDIGGPGYSSVKTDTFTKSVLQQCERRGDDWGATVKGRIEYYAGDLHAADSVYHHSCDGNFRSGFDVPQKFKDGSSPKRKKSGRPRNEDQEQAFSKLCSFLEANDEEQLTLSALGSKMKEFLSDDGAVQYGNRYLKCRLREHYGDSIYIAEREGLDDIVTMREKTSQILRSYFKSVENSDEATQKRATIEAAARLIKSDIKSEVPSVTDHCPSTDMLNVDAALRYLPDSLRMLLECLFVGTDKQRRVASIGQAVIQAVRPRAVLAPLQIGLGVQAHHLYRSRFIVETLNRMGFGPSYFEIMRFEKNAADIAAIDILGEDVDSSNLDIVFAADNIDHNIRTIDGKGTFHGMGMIAALTPGRKVNPTIPRKCVSVLKYVEQTRIDILDYRFAKHTSRQVLFKQLPARIDCHQTIDVLWELSLSFKQDTPNWQGMMHAIHQGSEHPGQSSIIYLPMIDMYSADKTCILSTLEFLWKQATSHNVTPIVTFDQPLYWKANEVILDAPQNSHLKEIVLLLGCFHTLMNLLGAIGTLMNGSGLEDILQVVYGENPVVHMLTGKAVQRAIRGHLLVDKCLNHMIVTNLIEESPEFASSVELSEELYDSLLIGETALETVVTSEILVTINEEMDKRKSELGGRSKTSQLWLNYMKMLTVVRTLIFADRTGSWSLHLNAVSNCLPIFAAAGHYNYLKSAHFYVQEMQELESSHPDVFDKFSRGLHVVRRSNQFWAGLSSDLVIEQTLMRSLKTSGGLTRGSGMTEEQRSLWTLSTPFTAKYNGAMQEFTNLSYEVSEQHKDFTGARVKRDTSDLDMISTKLAICSPFSDDPTLRNIVNGVVADANVNVHDYESVGMTIMQKMIGQPAFDVSFKRKDKAVTLGDVSALKVTPDQAIDPALLFQRVLVVSKTGALSLEDLMHYELSPFPTALFETRNVFRKADKPQIAHAIAEHCGNDACPETTLDQTPKTEHYVLDGGSLLHRLPWKKGDSYDTIAESYTDFTIRHYGKSTVVFDGYDGGPTIKDNTHQRRGGKKLHPIVSFTAETEFSGKKEDFLSRERNKQGLIELIACKMRLRECTVIMSPADADVDIAKAAVESSCDKSTTLIGEDTDLLVLLVYYAQTNSQDLYFRSDKSASSKVKVYDINRISSILGEDLKSQLLFAHAFSGCDSTSRIFGVGKKSLFQELVNGDSVMQYCAKQFVTPNQNRDSIADIGLKAMSIVCGGKSDQSLAFLRNNTLRKKIATTSSFVTPERLPPTASATKFHSQRVYYQIMVWMGRENGMDVKDWGWKEEDSQLLPVMSDMNAAPNELLHIIRCNCKTSCSTSRCSCRVYGLLCSPACGQCQVTNCHNQHSKQEIHTDGVDEDGQ